VTFCWFAEFRDPAAAGPTVGSGELVGLAGFLAATPNLRQALIFTPSRTSDPYLDDGPPPRLAMQLYFDDIAALEAAACGHLCDLAAEHALRPLADAQVTQQAMAVRRYPVPDATFRTPAGERPCTYLVAYEGEAANLHAWLTHYIADHPPIMARFPDIRQIEIYTCIDWCSALPWPRVHAAQQGGVRQPGGAHRGAELPVRHEMRAAFARFPPFTGPITHFPMATMTVAPQPG
jgi:hypothetical protein